MQQIDWEKNKENIIPLVSGREVNFLLQTIPSDIVQKTKDDFETAIHENYENKTKLLEIWSEYIFWFEQINHTKKGLNFHIERCLSDLDTSAEIFDSEKYVRIWLKYASLQDNKEDIFQYLISSGIGFSNSILYITYALFAEVSLNFKRADEIYNLGVRRNAKPREELEHSYRDYLHRLAAKPQQTQNSNSEEAKIRIAFTDIKTDDKKTSSQRPIFDQNALKNNAIRMISAEDEEKIQPSEEISKWSHPLIKSRSERDNIIPATKWEGIKIPSSKLSIQSKEGIEVHKVFQDSESVKFKKNRCYLLQPSTIPVPNENGTRLPWLVATENENDSREEYSAEELMSLRYYHTNCENIKYPLRFQLLDRLEKIPKRLIMFTHF